MGSWITIPLDARGGALEEASLGTLGGRITHTLLLLGTAGRCRGSSVPTRGLLRLAGLASAGQEAINVKSMSRYHLFVRVGLYL